MDTSKEKQINPRTLIYQICKDLDGATVLQMLRGTMGLSTATVNRAKAIPGGILLDGQPATVRDRGKAGQVLSIIIGDITVEQDLPPIPYPLDVTYEDEDLLVVNKAGGVVVHPTLNYNTDTLGNYVAYYYQQTGQQVAFRPVHRLDRGTSGLLCIAKHPHAQEKLKLQMQDKTMKRTYLALCEGEMTGDGWQTISAPIGRVEGSPIARQVIATGDRAVTHYQVLQIKAGRTLVEVQLETGRTHQIRVHLAHLGYPIVGDFLYGKEDSALGRTALHAKTLSFFHPMTGKQIICQAPVPQDMESFL